MKNGIRNVSGSLGGLRSVLEKLGAAVSAAFAVKKVVEFGKACVELGSDVAEVQNVVETAFGSMSDRVETFAQSAITTYGMSSLAAKKTASNYMAMGRGMGLAQKAAADMALELAGLSGDVASFFNISQEEAASKLRGVHTGETEALKDLGVVMTQTNLQQYAMAHGMSSNLSSMSQAQLVALRYAFVLDALSLAHGDFVRTQDSWANQTRILSMQWQEFMSIIGQSLITVLLPLVKVLNSIVAALIRMANAFNKAVQAIFGTAAKQVKEISDANSAIGSSALDAAAGEDALADSTTAAAKAAKKSLASFDELHKLQGSDSGGSGGIGGSTEIGVFDIGISETTERETGALDGLLGKLKAFWETFTAQLAPSVAAWSQAWSKIRQALDESLPILQQAMENYVENGLKPLARYFMLEFVPGIINGISLFLAPVAGDIISFAISACTSSLSALYGILTDAINAWIIPALDQLKTMWVDIATAWNDAWNTYISPVFQWAAQMIRDVCSILQSAFEQVINPIIATLIQNQTALWNDHLQPFFADLIAVVGDTVNLVAGRIKWLWDTVIAPLSGWLLDTFGPVIVKVFSLASGVVSTAFGIIVDVLDVGLVALKGVIDFLREVFEGDWASAWDVVRETVSRVWDAIRDTVGKAVDGVVDIVRKMVDTIRSAIEGILSALGGIGSAVSGAFSSVTSAFRGARSAVPTVAAASAVPIPALARGGVIPPNREFLAVLGDQRSGTNIEAPLDTIVQAFRTALGEFSGGGDGQPINIYIGEELLDSVIAGSQSRRMLRSGGR